MDFPTIGFLVSDQNITYPVMQGTVVEMLQVNDYRRDAIINIGGTRGVRVVVRYDAHKDFLRQLTHGARIDCKVEMRSLGTPPHPCTPKVLAIGNYDPVNPLFFSVDHMVEMSV